MGYKGINVSEETWEKMRKIREETGIPISSQVKLMLEGKRVGLGDQNAKC